MNNNSQLPDDIIYEIFKYLGPLKIAKIERVCKQWKDVARNNQALWRNGLSINKRFFYRPVTRRSYIRAEELLKRSGGTMDSLHLNLDDPKVVIRYPFHTLLLGANIQKLWIRMDPWQDEAWRNPRYWNKHAQILVQAYKKVIDAVEQISNLKSLHLECSNLGEDRFQSKPLASCRLETLALSDCQLITSLLTPSFLSMVSNIRVLQLDHGEFSKLTPCKSLLRLLDSVKDTVEELLMPCDWEVDWTDEDWMDGTTREVTLPKLTKLRIVATDD